MTASTSPVRVPAAAWAAPAWATRALAGLRVRAVSLAYLLPILTIGGIVNALGMAGSPQRIDDEGTYVAQAWAVLQYGELAHYTYWYDHPPLGWLQIAGYAGVTGAFERWDTAVLAGREAVLVATLLAGALLWVLARRLRIHRVGAAVAVLLFLLSPLAVQFHRTVYLDNIATAWLLLAFVLAASRSTQLAAFTGAAIAFGIAVLTKETYLLALPVLAWVMLRGADRSTRRYTVSLAATVLVLMGTSYILFAAVKGELLPSAGQVSLYDGIMFQLSARDGSGSALDPDSLMSATLGMWWQLDPVFILAGLAAAVVGLFLRTLRPFAVLVLGLTAFMFRPGGYLPVPYVIMLIPFAALLIAGVADAALRAVHQHSRPGLGATASRAGGAAVLGAGIVAALVATPLWATQLRGFVFADLDAPMRDAQAWIETNAQTSDRLLVDDAMWVDLVRAGWEREDVVWYYKADTDPEVQAQSPNGWRDTQFVVVTDSMRSFRAGFPEVRSAMDNSVTVASFGQNDQAVEVRMVMPEGLAESREAHVAAERQRASLGAQVGRNPGIDLGAGAAAPLGAGQVDARIATLLGSLASAGDVVVDDFPTVAGEDGSLRRQVSISEIGGAAAVVDGAPSARAQDVVDALTGAFVPQSVRVSGDDLVIRFDYDLAPSLP